MSAFFQPLVREPAAVAPAEKPLNYSYLFGTHGGVERHDPQVRSQIAQSPVDLRAISDLLRNREAVEG